MHLLIHDLNHSGTSSAASALANRLAENKKQANIIIIGEKKPLPFKISSKVEITFLGVKRPKNLVEKALYIPRSVLALTGYLKQNQLKTLLIYGKEFGCMTILLRSCLKLDFKAIIINSTYISGQLNYTKPPLSRAIHRFIYKRLLHKADHIIAICNAMVEDISSNYNVPRNKISVIYPPLAKKFFQTTSEKKSNNPKEVIFIGRLHKNKNPDKLIRAFTAIDNAVLRIIGDGDMMDELKNLSAELNLTDKIIFEGQKEDTVPYLQNADLMVMLSDFEGFGQVLAESIATGTPAVSFDCPVGPSEIIQDGINGYLVPQNDMKDFVAKIRLALEHKWDRDKIIATAERFHPDNILEKYLGLVESY